MKRRLFILMITSCLAMAQAQQVCLPTSLLNIPDSISKLSPYAIEVVNTYPSRNLYPRAQRASRVGSNLSTEGLDFWVTYMRNSQYGSESSDLQLQLIAVARQLATVTVTNEYTGWSTSTQIPANGLATLVIPANQAYNYMGQIAYTGLHVTSSSVISLYATNYAPYTYDATNVYPTAALGTSYIVAAYGNADFAITEFAVVATQDSTEVSFVPSKSTIEGYQAGTQYMVTLAKGQVISLQAYSSSNDLTGSYVHANHPVAVFQGDAQCNIPNGNAASDHIVEQAVPINAWGTDYVVVKSKNQAEDRLVIVAAVDGTQVFVDGVILTTLQAFESEELTLTSNASYIHANHPISVNQFISGGENNLPSHNGDPSQITVSPIGQSIDEITFGTFQSSITQTHFVNVVTTTASVPSTTLDGVSIANHMQLVPGNNTYSYAQLPIQQGTHTLYNPQGLSATVYGVGRYESYGYNVGCRADSINSIDVEESMIKSTCDTIHFCSSQLPVWIGSRYVYSSGLYSDTVVNGNSKEISNYYVDISPSFLKDTVIHITYGESYTWRGNTYSTSGEYREVYTNQYGCDSVYSLSLDVLKPNRDTTTTKMLLICNTDLPFQWDNLTIADEGIYTQHYSRNPYGDSLVVLNVQLLSSYHIVIRDTIPLGTQYSYRGQTYTPTKPGPFVREEQLSTIQGCDSVISLYLFVRDTNLVQYDTICYRPNYLFHNHIYPLPSMGNLLVAQDYVLEYRDSLLMQQYKMYLHILPEEYNERFIQDTICYGQSYWFGDQSISPSISSKIEWSDSLGKYFLREDYEHTIALPTGCDSTIHLQLSVALPDTVMLQQVSDTAVMFGNRWLTTSGLYTDTLVNRVGCDSIIILQLTILEPPVRQEPYRVSIAETICRGDTLQFGSRRITTAGTYVDTLTNNPLRDTIVTITLSVAPKYQVSSLLSIGQGDSLLWHNKYYSQQGIYYDSLVSSSGCDSICVLYLMVNPTYRFHSSDTICQSESYDFRGLQLTQSGLYYDSLLTIEGYDSIYSLELVVIPHDTLYSNETIKEGEYYVYYGDTLRSSGTYNAFRPAPSGCDSVIILNLTVLQPYLEHRYDSICSGYKIVWNGSEYSSSGDYSQIFEAQDGRDSVVTMHLTVHPIDSIQVVESACGSYVWNGQIYTASGNYTQTFTNQYGCDSVVTMNLVINSSEYVQIFDTICEGESYSDGVVTYTKTGVYQWKSVNALGCDSIITLILTVLPWPTNTFNLGSICADDEALYVPLVLSTEAQWNYAIRFDTLAKQCGFTDIPLTPYDGNDIRIELPTIGVYQYTIPNNYSAQLILSNNICSNPKTYPISYTVLYPSWIIHQKWNDVIGVMNKDYNGGFNFSSYQWYKDGQLIPDETDEILYMENGLLAGDYQALVTRETDGISMMTCAYHYDPMVSPAPSFTVTTIPTFVSRRFPTITISTNMPATFEIRDIVGNIIAAGTLDKEPVMVNLDQVSCSGVFVIYCKSNDGQSTSSKIIVQ